MSNTTATTAGRIIKTADFDGALTAGSSMRLLAKCPGCGGQLQFSISDLDKRKHCDRCGRLFKIPDAEHIKTALATASAVGEAVYVDEQGRIYG